MRRGEIRVGTAGWNLPKAFRSEFEHAPSILERYATRFDAGEINSTFYELPRRATIERWASVVPPHFRFAVKLPRTITHDAALRGVARELESFVELMAGFGNKLGPLLVQLPGSLELDMRSCRSFLSRLRSLHAGPVVLEPRNESFFGRRATELLLKHAIARVAADPARCEGADRPAGEPSLVYYRLHGSPRMYWDVYGPERLGALATTLTERSRAGIDVWCIFDNTALGGATHDALTLQRALVSC